MYVYFDNNVLPDLIRDRIDPVTSLAETEFVISVTPDLAAEYQQAIDNVKVPEDEKNLCSRLLRVAREVGIFGFDDAGGCSGLDRGTFANSEQASIIAETPMVLRPGKAIPKNRTDAFLAALSLGAIVVTNDDTGSHWKRARSAAQHVYSWSDVRGNEADPLELASRLRLLVAGKA
jgi:hypothetical protein